MEVEYCFAWTWPCLTSQVWAAWVQATGSVLAILVAIQVASHQADTARFEEARRLSQRLDAIALLIERMHEIAELIFNARHPNPKLPTFAVDAGDFGAFERAVVALQAIPLHEMPSEGALASMLSAVGSAKVRGLLDAWPR